MTTIRNLVGLFALTVASLPAVAMFTVPAHAQETVGSGQDTTTEVPKVYEDIVVLSANINSGGSVMDNLVRQNEEGRFEGFATAIYSSTLKPPTGGASVAVAIDLAPADPKRRLKDIADIASYLSTFGGETRITSFVGRKVDADQAADIVVREYYDSVLAAHSEKPSDAWNVVMIGVDGKIVVLPQASTSEEACLRSIRKAEENLTMVAQADVAPAGGSDPGITPEAKAGAAGSIMGSLASEAVQAAKASVSMTCVPVYAR